MDYLLAVVFGVTGCIAGFFVPKISNHIIAAKLSQRQRQKEKNFLDHKQWTAIIALVNGLLWTVIGHFASNIFIGLLMSILVTMALMFTLIDLIVHIIPNEMILVGTVIGTIYQISAFGFKHLWIPLLCMASIIIIFTVVGLIFGLHKIGAGDVKLAGLLGLIVGYPNIVYALLAMSIALIAYCVIGLSLGKLTHVSMFAFAPFLMIGLISGLAVALFPNIITALTN